MLSWDECWATVWGLLDGNDGWVSAAYEDGGRHLKGLSRVSLEDELLHGSPHIGDNRSTWSNLRVYISYLQKIYILL